MPGHIPDMFDGEKRARKAKGKTQALLGF